ncbi:hypothetical protein MASR1M32_33950 [Rhodobacter sp.]
MKRRWTCPPPSTPGFGSSAASAPWTDRSDCPKRGDAETGPECRIEIDSRWAPALAGIEKHQNLQVLYWMHLSRRDAVRQNPRHDSGSTGTFAIRSPLRPNPVASSVVRLLAVEGAMLTVRGLDCVDGTPLIDLKPEFGALWCDTSPQRR